MEGQGVALGMDHHQIHQSLRGIGGGELPAVPEIGLEGTRQPIIIAGADQFGVALVTGNLLLDQGHLLPAELIQIQLIAEGAGHGHHTPGAQGNGAAGLMVGAGRDMGAHGRNRVAEGGAVLNGQPLDGVGVVAAPELGHIGQHTGIEPAAAAGAALKQNVGEPGGQPVHQGIDPQDVPVEHLALALGGQGVAVHVRHVPVHVPLDVLDVVLAQKLGEAVGQIVHHLGAAHIQHQLAPAQDGLAAGQGQGPVGVGAVEVRVLADHLGLDPDAELHPQGVDLFDQGRKAPLELFGVDEPVAQAAGVAVPLAEPAVVQHHQPHTQAGGLLGDGVDLVLVEVKIGGLPVVDQHLAHLGAGGAAEGLPDEPVIVAGQFAQALVGVAEQHLGGGESFARGQMPPEPVGVNAGDQTGGAVVVHLDVGAVVAGVDRHHAVAAAPVLGGSGLTEDHKGVVMVAGSAPHTAHPADVPAQMGALGHPLHGVAAVELDQVPLAEGQIQAGGSGLFQGEGLTALVGQDSGPGDDVLGLVYAVEKLDPQPQHGVPQLDGQCLAVLAERSGQPLQGIGPGLDTVAGVDELSAPGAPGVHDIRCRYPEISPVGGGVFLGQNVRRVGAPDGLGRVKVGGETVVGGGIEVEVVSIADPAAIIQVQQVAHGVQLHLVGGVLGVKGKG